MNGADLFPGDRQFIAAPGRAVTSVNEKTAVIFTVGPVAIGMTVAAVLEQTPVRTSFDTVYGCLPPAVEVRLRRYAPHPCAPTDEEIAEQAYGDRTLDEIESDMFGKPSTGPL